MPASGPGSLPPVYTPGAAPGATLAAAGHDTLLHENDRLELRALWTKLGLGTFTPDALHKTLKATAPGVTSWDYHAPVKLGSASGTGASGVIEFTSIPAVFKHLLVRVTGRSDAAGTAGTELRLTFESSPTAGTYDHEQISAVNTTVSASQNVGTSDYILCGLFPTAGATSTLAGYAAIEIGDYTNTSIYKPVLVTGAALLELTSGSLQYKQAVGVWESTLAIDRVRLTLQSGNFATLSRATLYGVP